MLSAQIKVHSEEFPSNAQTEYFYTEHMLRYFKITNGFFKKKIISEKKRARKIGQMRIFFCLK